MGFIFGAKSELTGAERVGKCLEAWAARSRAKTGGRCAFVLDEAQLSDADVARDDMLLPLFLWHAENIYRYSVAPGGLGTVFQDDKDALLMRRVRIEPGFRSMTEILLFALEAAEDAYENLPKSAKFKGAAELRPLVNAFAQNLELNLKPSAERGAEAKPQV